MWGRSSPESQLQSQPAASWVTLEIPVPGFRTHPHPLHSARCKDIDYLLRMEELPAAPSPSLLPLHTALPPPHRDQDLQPSRASRCEKHEVCKRVMGGDEGSIT